MHTWPILLKAHMIRVASDKIDNAEQMRKAAAEINYTVDGLKERIDQLPGNLGPNVNETFEQTCLDDSDVGHVHGSLEIVDVFLRHFEQQ